MSASKLSLAQRIEESRKAAEHLKTVGQPVIVLRDNGEEFPTFIKYLPWELGHGEWVVGVEGVAGGYSTLRVRPA
jgi:hypothetical protein